MAARVADRAESGKFLAGPAGVEPATPDLEGELCNSAEMQSGALRELLPKFEEFCRIDRQSANRTIEDYCEHLTKLGHFLESTSKQPAQATTEDIRSFLSRFQDKSASTRANVLKALKVFFREFLKMPSVVQSFKFPKRTYAPRLVPSREDLQRFFGALDNDRDRAIFLIYATSGLRKSELLGLNLDDIDLENRLIIPKSAHTTGTTKNTWATCFNVEAQAYLKRYLAKRHTDDKHLFPISQTTLRRIFRGTRKKTGLDIRPQVLREWFCCQLGELGIPDRYVDAFCGRTPKSVLARHYTDYSPTKLKTIYDRANLTILT